MAGAPAQSFGTATGYSATLEGGIARQEQPAAAGELTLGHVVAVADGASDETRSTRTRKFLNSEGQMIDVAFDYLGRRNIGITYRVNGEHTASVVKRWRRGDGGWVLDGAEITSYEHGEVKARLNLTAENVQVAQRAPISDRLMGVASRTASLFLPTPAYAQDCGDEKLDVAVYGALATVSCGTGAVLACAASMYAFYRSLDALEECVAG